MARRRFGRRGSFYGRAKKFYGRARKPSISMMDALLAGAIYGAVRKPIAGLLPTFFNFGGIDSDNVILAGVGYFASRSPVKLIKAIGLIAMGTEAGIVTSNIITPMIAGNNGISSYDSGFSY